jgi:hypothetical protein
MYKVKTTPNYIEFDTIEYGLLKLRDRLLAGDLIAFEDMDQPSAREFAVFLLHRLIDTPVFDINEISNWTDELLDSVTRFWVDKKHGSAWELAPEQETFDAFYQSYKDHFQLDKWELSFRQQQEEMFNRVNGLGISAIASQASASHNMSLLSEGIASFARQFNDMGRLLMNMPIHVPDISSLIEPKVTFANKAIDVSWIKQLNPLGSIDTSFSKWMLEVSNQYISNPIWNQPLSAQFDKQLVGVGGIFSKSF